MACNHLPNALLSVILVRSITAEGWLWFKLYNSK